MYTHEMTFIREIDGIQEWYCEKCGRYIFVRPHPFKIMKVFDSGDITVPHSGMNLCVTK